LEQIGNMRILYVEDDRFEALVTVGVLERAGYEVTSCQNGEDALRAVEQSEFHLVLMDVDLGTGQNGAETSRKILHDHDLPIVFLSAHSEETFVQMVEGLSSYGYVLKHSKEFVLLQTLKQALRLHDERRKNREVTEQLRFLSDRYNQILDTISDGIYQFSADGTLVFASRATYELTGFPVGSVDGFGPEEVAARLHPEDRDKVILSIYEAIGQHRPSLSYTYRALKVDGTYFWCEDRARFLYDENGIYQGSYVSSRDISERLRVQDLLIEKERLSVVGELAASIAHDFNNTFQTISGNAELGLLMLDVDSPVRSAFETINRVVASAGKRAGALQRLAGGRAVNLPHAAVDFNALVTEVLDQLQPLLKNGTGGLGGQVVPRVDLRARLFVSGDRTGLHSVLVNLVKNAVEAMPSGGTMNVETHDFEGALQFRITDTGTGMNAETRKRMFQPFFSTKGQEKGRGLGLSSVRSIVEDHRGVIQVVRTAPGEGTCLELLFPAGEAFAAAESVTSPETPVGLRILWVDDDDEIRRVARELLPLLGHTVEVCREGREALDSLKYQTFDLLITDLGLPHLNGWQLAKQIAELHPGLPVVVLTGWGEFVTAEQLQAHRIHTLLSKPVSMAELKKALASIARRTS